MTEALISPQVLNWALERAQVPISRLTAVSPRALLWESGDAAPTFKQAQRIAKILHIPFGYLFLREPPEEATLLPDLRTIGDRAPGEFSPDLRDVINDALRRQAWYKDYAIESGLRSPPFIGRFSTDSDIFAVAQDITQTLGIDHEFRLSVRSWTDFLGALIKILRTGTR
ncbi:MAG: hypothetical protein L3J24_00700 [Xanthomonadales bacterium]|nr:hypothetical protein [Xanthomonadales bacterium]